MKTVTFFGLMVVANAIAPMSDGELKFILLVTVVLLVSELWAHDWSG